MEDRILMPKYCKGKKPVKVRKPSRPIDGINHRLLSEQAEKLALNEQAAEQNAAEVVEIPDDSAPPTRLELVDKAKELGLKFTKRTSDEKLLAMINEAIGG
jgi:hypothetical protein